MSKQEAEKIGTLEGQRGSNRKRIDGTLEPVRRKWYNTSVTVPRKLPEKWTEHGLCAGYRAGIEDTSGHEGVDWSEAQHGILPEGVKRKRLRCPRCGRRLLSSIRVCHDGCCIFHDIPPHKPKRWWKR